MKYLYYDIDIILNVKERKKKDSKIYLIMRYNFNFMCLKSEKNKMTSRFSFFFLSAMYLIMISK